MRTPYLTVLFLSLAISAGAAVWFNYTTDPFGLYRDDSARALSRIDQFYHMRSTKPLQLLKKKPEKIIVGSSRTARLSPIERGLKDVYNAAIPGATPTEMLDTLSFAHRNRSLQEAYIGWDFEGFSGLTEQRRAGFNTELMQATNPVSRLIQTLIAHKRTLFSFVATNESLAASRAPEAPRGPAYLSDGSWRRDSLQNIGPFGFALVSKDKVAEFSQQESHSLSIDEVTRTLTFCYEKKIACNVFATPVHLFHFELFEAAGLLPLWQEWHRKMVFINEELAEKYAAEPLRIWGFNTVEAAVAERIAKPENLEIPWFTDNVHFRPRFGHLMLRAMRDGGSEEHGVALTTDNVEAYLDSVEQLRKGYVRKNAGQVRRMKKNFEID